MFCPKCGSEIAEGSAFCGKCGAPVGGQAAGAAPPESAQGAASGGAGGGQAPAPKRSGAKIGVIAAAVVVAVVLVAGFATNWFGLAGVQPKEAMEVPAASQDTDEVRDANAADSHAADAGEDSGDAQGGFQAAASVTVKSAVEAYTWDELSQISAEIGAAGDEAAAVEVAKRYNLCTPEGKLDGTQVKSVTLADGTQTTVQIVGFAHDDKVQGGKAGITFLFKDALTNFPEIDAQATKEGWEGSGLRSGLAQNVAKMLPTDLKNVIVEVVKKSSVPSADQEGFVVVETSDKLWLPSMTELFGEIEMETSEEMNGALNAEGDQYELFQNQTMHAYGGEGGGNATLERRLEGQPVE